MKSMSKKDPMQYAGGDCKETPPDTVEGRLARIESHMELINESLTFIIEHITAVKTKYGPLEPVLVKLIRKHIVVDPKTGDPKVKLF